MEFTPFPKIPRLSRECVITEKLDGTNASILITDDGQIFAGSRNRWLNTNSDNYGFWLWVNENNEELLKLGPGHHFGEWWGRGIQRNYGLTERRFSLFNVHRWGEDRPECCHVVPTLYRGEFDTQTARAYLSVLQGCGSHAAPGFMKPEGIMIYHEHAKQYFKKTIEDDEKGKSE